jgi:hypothetical protein
MMYSPEKGKLEIEATKNNVSSKEVRSYYIEHLSLSVNVRLSFCHVGSAHDITIHLVPVRWALLNAQLINY